MYRSNEEQTANGQSESEQSQDGQSQDAQSMDSQSQPANSVDEQSVDGQSEDEQSEDEQLQDHAKTAPAESRMVSLEQALLGLDITMPTLPWVPCESISCSSLEIVYLNYVSKTSQRRNFGKACHFHFPGS